MAARNTTLTIPPSAWTEITDNDVSSITFQVGSQNVWIIATDGAIPSGFDGALFYEPRQGEVNVALADLFPGVTGATRVFVYSIYAESKITVSHA